MKSQSIKTALTGDRTEISSAGVLTVQAGRTKFYPMARAEVVEFTTDFLGGDSTSIEQVWYNQNTHRMTVQFIQGGLYSYDGVTPELFREFSESESLGAFFRETFRRPAGEPVWPGARHEETRTIFRRVPLDEPEKPEVDLDALKVTKLTGGKGTTFSIRYRYSAEGEMAVRAEDHLEAAKMLRDYMREKGFEVVVISATIPM